MQKTEEILSYILHSFYNFANSLFRCSTIRYAFVRPRVENGLRLRQRGRPT